MGQTATRHYIDIDRWGAFIGKAIERRRVIAKHHFPIFDTDAEGNRTFMLGGDNKLTWGIKYLVKHPEYADPIVIGMGDGLCFYVDVPNKKLSCQSKIPNEIADKNIPAQTSETAYKNFPAKTYKNFSKKSLRSQKDESQLLERMMINHPGALNSITPALVLNHNRTITDPYLYPKWRNTSYRDRAYMHFVSLYDKYDQVKALNIDLTHTTQDKARASRKGVNGYIAEKMSKAALAYKKDCNAEIDFHYIIEESKSGQLHIHGIIGFNGGGDRNDRKIRAALRRVNEDHNSGFTRREIKLKPINNLDYWIRYMSQDVPGKTLAMRIGKPTTSRGLTQMTESLYKQDRERYQLDYEFHNQQRGKDDLLQ